MSAEFGDEFSDIPNVGKWLYGRIHYYQYHPDARRWQQVIFEIRAAWVEGIKEIALANKRMRVRALSDQYEEVSAWLKASDGIRDCIRLSREARATLKQIAQEVGD